MQSTVITRYNRNPRWILVSQILNSQGYFSIGKDAQFAKIVGVLHIDCSDCIDPTSKEVGFALNFLRKLYRLVPESCSTISVWIAIVDLLIIVL